jgi:hypothetical protein
VQQLAGVAALVAVGRVGRFQTAELAQPDTHQQRRDRRQRHAQAHRDLGARHAQLAQHDDDLDELVGGAVRDRLRRRRAIQQPRVALG